MTTSKIIILNERGNFCSAVSKNRESFFITLIRFRCIYEAYLQNNLTKKFEDTMKFDGKLNMGLFGPSNILK